MAAWPSTRTAWAPRPGVDNAGTAPDTETPDPIVIDVQDGLSESEVSDLIRRIRAGEEGVLDALVRQYNSLVFAWQATNVRRTDRF